MPDRILIGVAWPYANGPLHLGHIAGAYLPADIFARYHRARGDDVLMVSGSDQHGTPITLRAEEEGRTPEEVAEQFHAEFLESWKRLGISFDLFTKTHTENHIETVQGIFLGLLQNGYLYRGTMRSFYSPTDDRFLPDRYVEGTCPYCGFARARGDQCDNCGKLLNPTELIEPRVGRTGQTVEVRETDHYFFRLSAFEEALSDWVSKQEHWRPNVKNFTAQWLRDGLKDRAFTRDIEWGVPIPVEGYDNKRIYVWFDAVTGYLSASKQWAIEHGDEEAWRAYWQGEGRSYYFIGKDNIPFHTIIWPSMLLGVGDLNLPYDVPANEFLTLEGQKFSTSRNFAVWLNDFLDRYDPDPLRYILSINMPESGDSDFSFREFVRRNNDELVATYGNLVHRVLTFTFRNFDGRIPTPGPLDGFDRGLLERIAATFRAYERAIECTQFREGIREAMTLAQEANRYLDIKAPWKTLKQDRAATATSLWTALSCIDALKLLLYPYLPFSSERLHAMLGYADRLRDHGWHWEPVAAETTLQPPAPLFSKLDEAVIDEELRRLGPGS